MPPRTKAARRLELVHRDLDGCRRCPEMVPPSVWGAPVESPVMLVGQAPGRHEGRLGRPFAWTAGKTLFRWFESALGVDEESVRAHVYFAAVARCFPGKAKGGGDRRPSRHEIETCREFLAREVEALRPELVLPVGGLAIDEIIGKGTKLAEVVGEVTRLKWHGSEVDVLALPHPSGASTWHRMEPGKTLLERALGRLGDHPAWRRAFATRGR